MIDTAYFLGLIFIFIRLTAFFLSAKIFFPTGTPTLLKGFLGMILSFAVMTGIDYSAVAEITNNYMLVSIIFSEVMCGLILGFVTNLAFEACRMAGAFMDTQAGLSMLNVLDPTTKVNSTLLANLSYQISLLIFFIIDGHHILIKCLIQSFDILPIGKTMAFSDSFMVILDAFIKYFVIGVKIAIPLVLIIIITDLCMALVSRTVPAINVMVLGMPVKIVLGLVTFIMLLPIFIKIVISSINYIPDIFQEIFKVLPAVPMVLIFASGDDKTEEATPKKKQDAKRKGQMAKSKDVGLAFTMVACTFVILTLSGFVVSNLIDSMTYFLQSGILMSIDENSLKAIVITVLTKLAICILPIAIPIMIAGVCGSLVQTGFMLTGEPLKMSFSKLNPISGFKNMFSKKSLADLAKNLAVVSVVSFIGYTYVKGKYESILQAANMYLPALGEEIKGLIIGIFFPICLVLIILGAIDYFVQFKFHKKDLRMSKQEVKEEYKQMEGDPQMKSKIKQRQREMSSKRMMQQVADATVVITNPTHLSIAISYKEGESEAPKVVAKGADLIAYKIKEVAKENDIPIMENKPLAWLLYEEVEIDQDIPQDMYQAVAEILAMVYKLKNKR